MSKTTKTIMAFLTAMTMTAGAMGATAYAKAPVATVVTESTQTDGVYSKGAEYHFISGPDVLIIDGEGTFTEKEFYETANKFDPRIVVIGDNIDIPVSGNVGDEWLFNISSLSSTFSVYTHESSKAYKLWKNELKKEFNDYLEANNIDIGYTSYGSIFTLFVLGDERGTDYDIYESFDYAPVVFEKGRNMEQYLLNNGIRKDVAREWIGNYMFGLNDRMKNWLDYPQFSANADGTERNKSTADFFKWKCLQGAETEQDLLDRMLEGKEGEGAVAKMLSDSNIDAIMSLSINFGYVDGSKHTIAFKSAGSVRSYEPAEKYEEEIYTADDTEDTTEPTELTTEKENMSKAAKILNAIKTKATLKGDADVNGTVELNDVIAVAKYNLSDTAYPLANETAYANADINEDKDIDGLDTSALIEDQLGRKG